MSSNSAKCESCGNEWELMKPVEEIERLRCSECGATGDSIQVETDEIEQDGSDKLSAFERIELKERHTDLRQRAEAIAEDVRELGDSTVPEELEPAYRRLMAVSEELSERDDLSASELDEIENFLEEKETELDDLDVADEIRDLEQRKRELMEDIDIANDITDLLEVKRELETDVEELRDRKRELKRSIGLFRSVTR